VTLTFNFDFGLDLPVQGGYGWGSPTPRRRSNCQTKTLKSGVRHQDELADRPVGRNVTSNCVIGLQVTDPSSHQRGRPTWKIKKVIVTQINVRSGHLLQEGQDTKTNWPTDRRSSCDFDFDLYSVLLYNERKWLKWRFLSTINNYLRKVLTPEDGQQGPKLVASIKYK
jgi:hypothetical protein